MHPFQKLKARIIRLSRTQKIILTGIIITAGWIIVSQFAGSKKQNIQYQTAVVEKGTLIISVTGSGQVSTANSMPVTTQATGVVSKVYKNDGAEVKTGDIIAEIDLDLYGQQKAAQTLASYQSAKNNLENAKTAMYSLQSDMLTQWKKHYDLAVNSTYQNSDGSPNNDNRTLAEFHISEKNWLAAEAKYKNQQNVVNQTQTSLNAAWLSYQQSSPIIYAPISGKVTGLSLQVGSVVSSNKIASIKTNTSHVVTVNLTEIDIPKIHIGNKTTVQFDAIPDKTYTGNVVSIDTSGTVSSGVTTYPTVIKLDTEASEILPNMVSSANIITTVKDNVLLVPAASVHIQDEESFVRRMKNGKTEQIRVETGIASETQIEIISGLSEGDVIITGSTQTGNSQQQNRTQSPFGGFGGGNIRFGGAGAIRR